MRSGTGAGDHIHNDSVLLQCLEHAQMRHAAGGSSTQGDSHPDAAQGVDDSLHAMIQDGATIRRRIGKGDLEVVADQLVKLIRSRHVHLVAIHDPNQR